MSVLHSNMELKVFEYNDEYLNLDKAENTIVKLEAGCTRNREDDEVTGVYFRWTYWIQKGNIDIVRCVGQDNYRIRDINMTELLILAQNSYQNYREQMNKRFDILNLPIPILSYNFEGSNLNDLVEELNS